MSFNFNGFVALRRGLQEELQLGNLSNTEGLVLITLILNADAATGRGTINAPTLLSFLPGLLLSTAKDTLLSLQKKGHIWRNITPYSKRVYPYWVNGYEVSRGRYKGLRISLAEVFKSKDIRAIRYEHPAPHDQPETLPEGLPQALPVTPPDTLPDIGHNYNNDKENDKDKYKQKNKNKNAINNELIVNSIEQSLDCTDIDIEPCIETVVESSGVCEDIPSCVSLKAEVPTEPNKTNLLREQDEKQDIPPNIALRPAQDDGREIRHDTGTEGEAPPPIPRPPSPSEAPAPVWPPARFRPRSDTQADLVCELARMGMYLDEDDNTRESATHQIVSLSERKKRVRAYKENRKQARQLQDLDPSEFVSESVGSYE